MMLDIQFLVLVISAVGAGGIAWGAAKAAATETRQSVNELKEAIEDHIKEDHRVQLQNVAQLAMLRTLVSEVHKVVVRK